MNEALEFNAEFCVLDKMFRPWLWLCSIICVTKPALERGSRYTSL